MRHWALQYCRHVRILTPRDLAETVKEDLQQALNTYMT
jgi:predicted DNA-binding transcriptional regulator YafY